MSHKRDICKEVVKTTGFHSKTEADHQPRLPAAGNKHSRPTKGLTKSHQQQQPISVMFIPRTRSGFLLTALRQVENSISEAWPTANRRIKLVEEGGRKIRSIIIKDPWTATACPRAQCNACKGESPQLGNCNLRSLLYENSCLICKTKDISSRYIGETSCAVWERNS